MISGWKDCIFDILDATKYILEMNFTCFFLCFKTATIGNLKWLCGPLILQEMEGEKQKCGKCWVRVLAGGDTDPARVKVAFVTYYIIKASFLSWECMVVGGGHHTLYFIAWFIFFSF